MSERRSVYNGSRIVGNNALVLDRHMNLPEKVNNENMETQMKNNNKYRSEPRIDTNYAKINTLCTFVLAFVIIATLGVCVVFLKTQFSYSEINNKIESVKRELNTIKRENIQLEENLEAMVDLERIYLAATTRLNMRLPGPEDVLFIESNPVSYTTKYGPVKIKTEEISIGNVLGYITKGW